MQAAACSSRGAELIWFIMLRKSNYYSYKLVLRPPRPKSAGRTVRAGPKYSENSARRPDGRKETLNQLRIGFKVL